MKPKHLFTPQGNNAWSVVDAWQSHAWLMGYNRQRGHDPCNWMRLDYVRLLMWVVRSVYWETQELPGSPTLIMGDFSNRVECKGHPGGTHADGFTFDHNYYTHGRNFTQYRPLGMAGAPETMWKNLVCKKADVAWYDGTLDTKVFNWQRNWLFWKKLLTIFSKKPDYAEHINRSYSLVIMVHERIKDYVVSRLTGEDKILALKLQGFGMYNHHIHAHIQLVDIDWEAEV
jgi:hypothetical protein